MSQHFFDRMSRELAQLMAEIRRLQIGHEEFDKEVERVSGMDCDDAADRLSRNEFRRVAEEALEALKQKRRAPRKEMVAIA